MVPSDLSIRIVTPLKLTFDVGNLPVGHAMVAVGSVSLWLHKMKKKPAKTATVVKYLQSLSDQSQMLFSSRQQKSRVFDC